MDLLRGPDDDRADALALQAKWASLQSTGYGQCARCHDHDTVLYGTLCLMCADDTRWSRANRQMCAWLHRDSVR
jgi:hypothetical protein